MLNLNHLRLFEAAARTGGISRAARELRLSQPAVSKQIGELEAAVGQPLLERVPRGVRVTAAGAVLAEYARRLFTLAEEAERALDELRHLRRGRLGIGASMTIGVYLAPPLLAAFRRRHPDIEIEFFIGNTDAVQKRLAERELDVGMTEGPGALESELESETFRWDELIVVAPPRRRQGRLDDAALAREAWVMREPGSGTRAVVDAALAARGLRVTPVWTFNNPEAVKRAVMAGCGIAMVPRITADAELATGALRRLRAPGLERRRPLRLQWRKGLPPSAVVTAFRRLCAPPVGAMRK